MYDIIVVGGGPAGLTAALYARRANKSVLVIEKATFGGQITFSPKVENIAGFTEISGNEFAEKAVDQVLFQGAEFEACEVTAIEDGDIKRVITDGGIFECRALIIATGAKHRLMGIDGEKELIGNGISFCAVCDGAFYRGKTVGVVGGGNSALQEALLLSELAEKVFVIQNLENLTGERRLAEQLGGRENVEILLGKTVCSVKGDEYLTGITVRDEKSGELQNIDVDGLFVAIGLVPQNEPFSGLVSLNEYGYVLSDENCCTAAKGVFVAGDCRTKSVRQVATAVSDGAVAALTACEYIDKISCSA